MKLKRQLTLFHVFCIATGAMVSSGIFVLPGMAFERAGPAVVISYFLAGVLCIAGMASLAEMTTAMPKAGGDCFSIIRSMGPGMGTVAGVLSWFSLSMKSSFALVGMSLLTVLFIDVDMYLVSTFFCALFVTINILGVKEAARTQVILVMGLLGIMTVYIVFGLPLVRTENFTPLASQGTTAIFSTAGFVFVAYAGLLKIASVAEEVKNPSRNIPLGMMLSLLVVMVFYTLMVFVSVGVMDASDLAGSLTPISDGAEVTMGSLGVTALSIAAILAFLSTANAGIMTAARSLVPLSEDHLLPDPIGRIHERFGTPSNAILVTGLSIQVFLFLSLEILVEAASVVLLLINILLCLSVIILRESRLRNYQPSFKAPLYPWLQVFGIVSVGFLLFEMGPEALLISGLLILGGVLIYWTHGRKTTLKEFALLHVIERITDRAITTGTLETELREILRERDDITEERFRNIIHQCPVVDHSATILTADLVTLKVVSMLKDRIPVHPHALYNSLLTREKSAGVMVGSGVIIPSIIIPGQGFLEVVIVRCREGISFAQEHAPAHTMFIVISTEDNYQFYLHTLMWIARIVFRPDFQKRWLEATDEADMKKTIIELWDSI